MQQQFLKGNDTITQLTLSSVVLEKAAPDLPPLAAHANDVAKLLMYDFSMSTLLLPGKEDEADDTSLDDSLLLAEMCGFINACRTEWN
jgi:hypothetical protein